MNATNPSFRSGLRWVHTWSGLTVGLAVLFLAITAAAFVLRPQLDPIVNRDLLVVPACTRPLPLDALAEPARAAYPAARLAGVELSTRPTASAAFLFSDEEYVYLDPCSGHVLGRQNTYGGFFGTFDGLHRMHFLPRSMGRITAGWIAVAFGLLLIAGGLILWWPRTVRAARGALSFQYRLRGRARTLSLHRVVGVYASLMLLMIVITGLFIAFMPLKQVLYDAWGYAPPRAPSSLPAPGARPLSLEQAWHQARVELPTLYWAAITLPTAPNGAVMVEALERGAAHVDAKSVLYLDAYSGRPLSLRHFADIGLGRRIYLYMLALHSGLVGGLPYQLLLLLTVLTVPVQAYSGISPYLRRKLRAGPPRPLTLRLVGKHIETPNVCSYELAHPQGRRLPRFTAGAHIDIRLRHGLVRQYSLCNDPRERHRYVIAVLRRDDSRGGSRTMHETLGVGDLIEASEPRNHFPLARGARHSLLIAGGIGVTPMMSMAHSLSAAGADFQLHYCVRSADQAPFLPALQRPPFAGRLRLHVGTDPDGRLDVPALLDACGEGTHVYVCGPHSLMDAVVTHARMRGWAPERIHCESFRGSTHDPADNQPFDLKIASTGRLIRVASDQTALGALSDAGIDVPNSCSEGVCGTCLTHVLEGEIEHRDSVLTPEQRARNDQFTPCCSRARSPVLVLDL